MSKPKLAVVAPQKKGEDPEAHRKRLIAAKRGLMKAAVAYVSDGKDGECWQDRLRTASDLSGIPRNIIEVELKK